MDTLVMQFLASLSQEMHQRQREQQQEQEQQHASSHENKEEDDERGESTLQPKLSHENDSIFPSGTDVFSAQLNPPQPVFPLANPRVIPIASTFVISATFKGSDEEPPVCVAPKQFDFNPLCFHNKP